MKKSFIFIFLGVGLIAGILLVRQFAGGISVDEILPVGELQAKEDLFKDFLDEQTYLQSRIVSLREQIETAENEIAVQSKIASISFLDDLKEDVGLSEVNGNGIEILLDDSPFALREGFEVSDIDLVQAADIRDIVNILYAANARAISVNNQRIVATSPISSVGTTILINNAHTAPPFTISAVGDKDLILQRLQNDSLLASLFERASKNEVVFQVSVKEWVSIPIYNGDIKVNYLNLIN